MKETTKRMILILSFALVLAALAVTLPLLFRKGALKPVSAEPLTVITPEPTTEEDDVVMRTPVPTPARTVATPRPDYPEKAVNLLVNGTPLFAVANREVAEQLVRIYLDECARENLADNAVLLTASIDAAISTVPADGSIEYAEFDVAINRLRKNRSLIPVRRTVSRVDAITETPAPQNEQTTLLPEGARMFRRLGVFSRTLIYVETLYKDGLAVSETETLRIPMQTGIPRFTLTGVYRLPETFDPNDPEAREGEPGPVPASLSFSAPVRGRIAAKYGLASGEMRYGVDYAAAPGTRVVAPESGTVIFLGERPGLGFVIEIRHEEGFVSRLSFGAKAVKTDLVLEKHVKKGEPLAALPENEGEKEAFLHYELLIDGIPYNPLYYIPAK
ncbi:MAG: M23 family metallopeptidase [Clostridia bacterium]|nr:M23 family metallopeptidase [Clostridia bacterium]